jgi:AcrR family transcriptional regulator
MSHSAARTDPIAPLTPAALATRVSIIDTAERLFRTLGYQKTTVADIARELRMSPANIYRFFASKGAINEAIAERLLDQILTDMWAIANGPASAPDRLRALFRLLREQTVALFFQERRMHDMVRAAMDEHWGVVERYKTSTEQAFLKIIRDGTAAGVFGGMPPEVASRMVHASCVVFVHPALVEQCQDTEDLGAMADGMAEFCLRALRPD